MRRSTLCYNDFEFEYRVFVDKSNTKYISQVTYEYNGELTYRINVVYLNAQFF